MRHERFETLPTVRRRLRQHVVVLHASRAQTGQASRGGRSPQGRYVGLMTDLSLTAERVLQPRSLTHPAEVRGAPAEPGIYGWWMRVDSLDVPPADYRENDGFELLYVGISPRRPGAAGRVSKGNIRKRLNQHVNGNASQSTLRRTLGVLLTARLGLTLGMHSGRTHYGDGEPLITRWMHENARVAYAIDPKPWEAEGELLEHAVLALNISGRGDDEFARSISAQRTAARGAARSV